MDSSFNLAVHALVCLSHSGRSLSSEALAKNICTNPTRVRRVLVDFWAQWCPYCRRIAPAFDKVGEQYADTLMGGLQIHPRQYRRALRNVSDKDQEVEKGSAVNCREVQQKAQPQRTSAAALLSIPKASASRSTILPSKSATPFHF